jgi:hypothetical protein
LTLNFIAYNFYPKPQYDNIEDFNPSLLYLNTLNKLEQHVDSIASNKAVDIHSIDYLEILAKTIRQRFYFGYSEYSLSKNWLAACSGYFIWYDLSCIVRPEEIIQYPYAACSQQSMVFMWLLRQKHISYRSVKFPHHYTIEVQVGNHWYYFDTTYEPNIKGKERITDGWNNSADSLKKFYINQPSYLKVEAYFDHNLKFENGKINDNPALNARIFHLTTYVLSKTAWILPLLLLFFLEKKKNKKNLNSTSI